MGCWVCQGLGGNPGVFYIKNSTDSQVPCWLGERRTPRSLENEVWVGTGGVRKQSSQASLVFPAPLVQRQAYPSRMCSPPRPQRSMTQGLLILHSAGVVGTVALSSAQSWPGPPGHPADWPPPRSVLILPRFLAPKNVFSPFFCCRGLVLMAFLLHCPPPVHGMACP